jgi:hypothetical protein
VGPSLDARHRVFTGRQSLLLSFGSGSNAALDMSPEPLIRGGLQAWIKSQPLGAARDTEERRADVLSYDPNGKNEKIVAIGLCNCAGITIQPATGLPWCVVIRVDSEDAKIATMKAAVNRGAIVSIVRRIKKWTWVSSGSATWVRQWR